MRLATEICEVPIIVRLAQQFRLMKSTIPMAQESWGPTSSTNLHGIWARQLSAGSIVYTDIEAVRYIFEGGPLTPV